MTVEPAPASLAQQAAVATVAGLVGVVVGIAGAVVHRQVWRPAGVLLPWGLVLALATGFVVIVAAGQLFRGPGTFGVAGGWVVLLLWLQPARTEGDYVFAGDFLGSAYVLGGMVTMALAVVRGMTTRVRGGPP